MDLESDPRPELDQPGVVNLAANHAKLTVRQGRIGITEVGRVGGIERLGPELRLDSLPDGERFEHGHVPVEQCGTADVEEPRDIAKGELRSLRERRGAEPSVDPLVGGTRGGGGHSGRVRQLIAGAEHAVVIRLRHRQGKSRLQDAHYVGRPAARNPVEDAAVRQKRLPFPERQLIRYRRSEPVRRILRGQAPLRALVMDVIWAAPAVLTPRASVALLDQVYDASRVSPFLKRRSARKYQE